MRNLFLCLIFLACAVGCGALGHGPEGHCTIYGPGLPHQTEIAQEGVCVSSHINRAGDEIRFRVGVSIGVADWRSVFFSIWRTLDALHREFKILECEEPVPLSSQIPFSEKLWSVDCKIETVDISGHSSGKAVPAGKDTVDRVGEDQVDIPEW